MSLVSFGIFLPLSKSPRQWPNLLLSTVKVIFRVPLPPLQDQDAPHLASSIVRVVILASVPAPSRSDIDERSDLGQIPHRA
jgi:hypothetical protein